jgi:GNAT superfamily N-acetyltransferase
MAVLAFVNGVDNTPRMDTPALLRRHLETWLGAWPPPRPGITVVGSTSRTTPGWDGEIRPLRGVATPEGTVISVPPDIVDRVTPYASDVLNVAAAVTAELGLKGWRSSVGIFRWSERPTEGPDAGVWVNPAADGVPDWLGPFNGDVLIGYDQGVPAAGVGRKMHDAFGHELAVVTEPEFRGRGWAASLVAQAARRVLADGAIPTYLHGDANLASARTADVAGFHDHGWKVVGLFPRRIG